MLTTVTQASRRAAKQQLLADSRPGTRCRRCWPGRSPPAMRSRSIGFASASRPIPEPRWRMDAMGNPLKLRGEVGDWLVMFCQERPHTPSHVVQAALQERFGLRVSISQLNRFRAAHGISSRRRGKKRAAVPTEASSPEPVWQEEAGSLLLLAAATRPGWSRHSTPRCLLPVPPARPAWRTPPAQVANAYG